MLRFRVLVLVVVIVLGAVPRTIFVLRFRVLVLVVVIVLGAVPRTVCGVLFFLVSVLHIGDMQAAAGRVRQLKQRVALFELLDRISDRSTLTWCDGFVFKADDIAGR